MNDEKNILCGIILEDKVCYPHTQILINKSTQLPEKSWSSFLRGKTNLGIAFKNKNKNVEWGILVKPVERVKMPSHGFGILVQGVEIFKIERIKKKNEYIQLEVIFPKRKNENLGIRERAEIKKFVTQSKKYLASIKDIALEKENLGTYLENPEKLSYFVASYLSLSLQEKMEIFITQPMLPLVQKVNSFLSRELKIQNFSASLQDSLEEELKDEHKIHYLQEQLRLIKKELSEVEGGNAETQEFSDWLTSANLSQELKDVCKKEMERMEMMAVGSPDYFISYNYLKTMKEFPWVYEPLKFPSIRFAEKSLSKEHFALERVKDKILDYLSTVIHTKKIQGKIILLVGPPGVGKTSLAKSISKAMQREFIKIALGGVRDEAEIRGHRRTYIGSMPGKIVQSLSKCKTSTAVILLDEIDKVGGKDSTHGDVGAALLEVLDPEQNTQFLDHYLGVPINLSNCIFIATANSLENMPSALLDRMEIIEVTSYTEDEKLSIAKKHIIPELKKSLKLKRGGLQLRDENILEIIRHYTREAGVRQLKRNIETLFQKNIRYFLQKNISRQKSVHDLMLDWLGPKKFLSEPVEKNLSPGVAIGLAYTEHGGDLLYVETSLHHQGNSGKTNLKLTGSLGDVMKESVETAWSYLRSVKSPLEDDAKKMLDREVHVHFPDGGTPKDGPSAGVAILSALTSLLLDKSIDSAWVMTGEITLRGQVLPVGGIKEKILAAYRYGKYKIILPEMNRQDLYEIPKNILQQLKIYYVSSMKEVLQHAGLLGPQRHFTVIGKSSSKAL